MLIETISFKGITFHPSNFIGQEKLFTQDLMYVIRITLHLNNLMVQSMGTVFNRALSAVKWTAFFAFLVGSVKLLIVILRQSHDMIILYYEYK